MGDMGCPEPLLSADQIHIPSRTGCWAWTSLSRWVSTYQNTTVSQHIDQSERYEELYPMRTLPLQVGRSVARAKPLNTNAIFDCKVLSRNHALLWYENGKFYLQDTKSSNGTFVNNQRLSKGSEESPAREVTNQKH